MTTQIIVTASEMQQIEQKAFQDGLSPAIFMENAGKAIARALNTCSNTALLPKILLVGKGNNGGDALVAGCHLLNSGNEVIALLTAPPSELSPLAQTAYQRFLSLQGQSFHLQPGTSLSSLPLPSKALFLDGLLGTGFTPPLTPFLEALIKDVNASPCPVYSIDIPSGISGDSGRQGSPAITAKGTFSLGTPKKGLFLPGSWENVGSLTSIEFGLPKKYLQRDASLHLATLPHTATLLPPIPRTRHKYQAGALLILCGVPGMEGATALASLGAFRSGVGIVDILHTTKNPSLKALPLETRELFWEVNSPLPKSQATTWLIGPGRAATQETTKLLSQLIAAHPQHRFVIDGGALQASAATKWPEGSILTPHYGEAERLLDTQPTLEACQNFVNDTNTILLLKGAPTFLFSPNQAAYIIPFGSPGMATAGSGDVLAGIIAAQVAQNLAPTKAALLAAVLHGLAGECAESIYTKQGMMATDIINAIPQALKKLINK